MDKALLLNLADPLRDAIALARRAEAAGVDGVYLIEGGREAVAPLAAIAAATSTVRLGTYVLNAYGRNPFHTGLSALDLDELSGGRLVLGLGAGNPFQNGWALGVDSLKPMAKMRDYLAIVNAMVRARAGERVIHNGPVHSTRWRAARDPYRDAIPVWVAAAGPNMTALAGALSDGVAVGILVSPEHLDGFIRPHAAAAAEAAGRDPSALRFPVGALTVVDHDEERARRVAREVVCRLYHPIPHPYYDHLLRVQGFAAVADAAEDLVPQRRVDEAMAQVSDELLDRLTLSGTPQQCADRLRAYEGAADEVVLLNFTPESEPGAGDAYDGVFEMLALAARSR